MEQASIRLSRYFPGKCDRKSHPEFSAPCPGVAALSSYKRTRTLSRSLEFLRWQSPGGFPLPAAYSRKHYDQQLEHHGHYPLLHCKVVPGLMHADSVEAMSTIDRQNKNPDHLETR